MGLRGFPNVQGGVERHCEMLYPRIAARGIQPKVYVRSQYVMAGLESYMGVDLIRLPIIKSSGIEAVAHTGMAVIHAKRVGAKLIHIHAIGPAIWSQFARKLGLKVVVTHHGFDYRREKWGDAARMILRAGERSAIQSAHGLIVISREIQKEMLTRKAQGIVELIPNGVVLPSSTPDPATLAQWGLEPGRYGLLTARFVREKGILDLIRAWDASGVEQRHGIRLAIAGGEDHPSVHGEEIRALAAERGVVLTGMLSGSTLAAIYAHAGFFCLPSSHEGLPISLLEAMSWSLPVIASDIEANLEVGLEPSCYFPVGNVEALADRIRLLCDRGTERVDYAGLMTRFNWDTIADRTSALYRRLLPQDEARRQTIVSRLKEMTRANTPILPKRPEIKLPPRRRPKDDQSPG